MRFGDAEVSEQEGCGLGLHRAAVIGVQGQLTGRDGVLGQRLLEQGLEQGGALSIGDAPAEPEGSAQLRHGG